MAHRYHDWISGLCSLGRRGWFRCPGRNLHAGIVEYHHRSALHREHPHRGRWVRQHATVLAIFGIPVSIPNRAFLPLFMRMPRAIILDCLRLETSVKMIVRVVLASLFMAVPALGQHYKVLYSFKGPKVGDAAYSNGGLLRDMSGNLYGTTVGGGLSGCQPYGSCGTVFELSPNSDGSWSESVLYTFCSNRVSGVCFDGEMPGGGLLMDSEGNLYGTTLVGGSTPCPGSEGCGTVFELSPPAVPGLAWTETVLYNFCESLVNNSCLDGSAPVARP